MTVRTSSHSFYEETPSTFGRFFILLFAALTVTIIMAAIAYNDHAVERHGAAAGLVRQCMSSNGPAETWLNPSNGREAHICEIDEGLYGIQIEEDGREVTSFIKEKFSRIDQVRQYLINGGYGP